MDRHTQTHKRMTFLESTRLNSAGMTVGVLEVLRLPIRTSACWKEKACESNSDQEGERDVQRERERGADRQEARITAGLYHQLLKPDPQVKWRHTFATESIKVQTITMQEAVPQARQHDMT